ncbi:MAG TPA: S66 peptidase family protein [Methanomassiliicoccales archaeon]|nr:S66 peptidase family protein [Methanomassiliicoccales archaeon]
MVIKPRRLRKGDTIGIVAPSNSASLVDPRIFDMGVKKLESKGFKLRFGNNIRARWGHTAGTVQQRLEDLMDMFEDPEVDAIMTVFGGFNSHQLLHYIDYEVIRENPKVFIGFSDITALSNAFLSRSGLVNFSGPAFVTFCQPDLPEFTERYFEEILMEGKRSIITASKEWAEDSWWGEPINFGKREWKENPGWEVFSSGIAEGSCVGGNISTLMLLAGTDYWPDMEGKILFLDEDDGETPQTIDRYLTQLRHMGVYDEISGMVLGRFPTKVGFSKEDTLSMIFEEATRGYDFPIISGVDFAHTDPMITIPLGVRCIVDADNQRIELMESAVK